METSRPFTADTSSINNAWTNCVRGTMPSVQPVERLSIIPAKAQRNHPSQMGPTTTMTMMMRSQHQRLQPQVWGMAETTLCSMMLCHNIKTLRRTTQSPDSSRVTKPWLQLPAAVTPIRVKGRVKF